MKIMNKSILVGLGLVILTVSGSAGLAAQRHHHLRMVNPNPSQFRGAMASSEYGDDGYCGFPGCRGPMDASAFAGGAGGPLDAMAGPYDAYAGPSGGFAGAGGRWTPGTTLNSDYEMYRRNKRDAGLK